MSEKNKPQITEFLFPPLSRKQADHPSNKMSLTAKLILAVLIIMAAFISSILLNQRDVSYRSQLINSLDLLTQTEQGTVTVLASKTGLDASIATSFHAAADKPQKTQTRLDYLKSDNLDRDIELLDIFRDPYAELPLSDDRIWVSVKTEEDIKSLENLGFPVGTLVDENAHTPLLPFGNFTDAQARKINHRLKSAFADADFIRADNGILEFQAEITKHEAKTITGSTQDTGEPMSLTAAMELYESNELVTLSLKVERGTGRLTEVELVASINNERVQANYSFDYSKVKLPKTPPDSISASKFVNLYLKSIRDN